MKSKIPSKVAISKVFTARNKAVAADKKSNQKLACHYKKIRASARRPLPIPSCRKK